MGHRPALSAEIFLNADRIDFLEITAEHFLDVPNAKREELRLLRERFRLIPHGLNLSLGSAEGIDGAYLDRLAALVEEVEPPWWSEHVAWTRAGGRELGHLAPTPRNRESIEVIARNAAIARRVVDRPLILENITATIDPPGSTMSEGAFLRALVDETGCGLLLDATNLFTNAANRGEDPRRQLDDWPLESVVQLHFAGGWVEEGTGLWVDAHDHPTPEPVWALMEEILARCAPRGAILERDGRFPPIGELLSELERARELGRRHGRWA